MISSGTVGADVTVTDRCVIGAGCDLSCKETLSHDTIIYGADCRRYHKKVPLQVCNPPLLCSKKRLDSLQSVFLDNRSTAIGIPDQSTAELPPSDQINHLDTYYTFFIGVKKKFF